MGWFSKLFTRKGKNQNRKAIEKLENGIRRGNIKVQTFNPYANRNKWTEHGVNKFPLYANSNSYKTRKQTNNMIKKTMNNARVMPWIKPLNSYPKSNALTKRMQKHAKRLNNIERQKLANINNLNRRYGPNKNLITFPDKNLITFPDKNLITFPDKNLITFPEKYNNNPFNNFSNFRRNRHNPNILTGRRNALANSILRNAARRATRKN